MLDDIKRRIKNSPKYTIDKIKSIRNTPQYTYLNSLGIGFWAFVIITSLLGLIFLFYVESVIKIMVSGYGYLGI
ncbi:MAG TPA: hypothetical protein VEC16_06840, partial [Alphaproteobacteria bacterium]|nr:hypothetical protein [Alphaproteobacteria bacterium]